jgi:hypothetical protein
MCGGKVVVIEVEGLVRLPVLAEGTVAWANWRARDYSGRRESLERS